MEMMSGSQINSFLSATSLIWASSIVLMMIGLVYFIKYKERHDSIKDYQFFIFYLITICLNIFEYVLNLVMQKNPSYETYIYKFYILLGFFWNISMIFYVVYYINPDSQKHILSKCAKVFLIALAIISCMVFDIGTSLESNGKFYILVGELNTIYSACSITSFILLVIISVIYRKELPKGFCSLCILTFVLYALITVFKYFTGYVTKESVFVYSILVLIIFNTTSNQDKEIVHKLTEEKDRLANINVRRSKLINKISSQIDEPLNDLVLYNDELYLTKEINKELIINSSKEVNNISLELADYITNIKDVISIEANNNLTNRDYNIVSLTKYIYSQITPLARSKKISFSIDIVDKTLLNYVGDVNKIGKAITNILYNIINSDSENKDVNLTISSKKRDLKHIDLNFEIKNNDLANNDDLTKLKLNDFIESKSIFNKYDVKKIVSNEILDRLDSKIDMKKDDKNNIYSFSIIQGFKDGELYNN